MNINQQKSPQLDQINLLMLSILIIGRNKLEENTFIFTYNNIMHMENTQHITLLCNDHNIYLKFRKKKVW